MVQSERPAMKARVPSIGSTIHTRRADEPRRIVLGFLRQPAGVGHDRGEPLLEEGVDRDIDLGDRGVVFLGPGLQRFAGGFERERAGDAHRIGERCGDGG